MRIDFMHSSDGRHAWQRTELPRYGCGREIACEEMPAAIPTGLIKACMHTYAGLAVLIVAYNADKACAFLRV